MGSVRRLQRRQKKHGGTCSCCGQDWPWMDLWFDNVHVGVRLRPDNRSRTEVERDATSAVFESRLDTHEAGHCVEVLHNDGCPMDEGGDVCTCGPYIFAKGTFA